MSATDHLVLGTLAASWGASPSTCIEVVEKANELFRGTTDGVKMMRWLRECKERGWIIEPWQSED